MNADQPLSELFVTIGSWAMSHGADDLANKPGLWTRCCGEFVVSINAHREELKTPDGITVLPFCALVNAPRYLGTVLMVGPYGGIAPPGMEDDVITALKADTGESHR